MIYIQANHNGNISALDTVGAEIELNLEFQDLFDISVRRSPHSFHFVLPMTHTNNKFFGMYYNVNVALTDFDPTQKTKVELFDDGYRVIEGYLELTGVNVSKKTYEVVVISTLADAFDNIKGSTWSSVINGSLNHVLSDTNVVDSWTQSNDITISGSGAGNVVYSLADLAKYSVGSYSNYPFISFSSSTLEFGITNSGVPIQPHNLRPFVRVKYLMEQIFSRAGYSIQGDWISSIANLYCSVGISKSELLGRPFYRSKVGTLADITYVNTELTHVPLNDETGPYFSDSDNLFQGGYFIAPMEGYYTFKSVLHLETNPLGGGVSGGFLVGQVWQTQTTAVASNWGMTSFGGATAQVTVNSLTQTIHLQAGEAMGIYISCDTGNAYPPTMITYFGTPDNVSYVSLEAFSLTADDNAVVDIAPNMDEEVVDKWIQGIIQQFNLFLFLDPEYTNVIVIETYDDFVDNYSAEYDWTDKVDLNSDFIIKPTTFYQDKEILFTQAESNDAKNAPYNLAHNYIFGHYQYSNGNEFTDGVKTIGDYFSPMRLSKLINPFDSNAEVGEMVIPCAYTEDFKTIKSGPVLAYYHSTKATDNLIPIYVGGVATSLYPLFTAWSESPVTANSKNVSFGTNGTHDYVDNQHIALNNIALPFSDSFSYYDYWRNYIEEAYGERSRYLKMSAVLTAQDVGVLQWNDRIFIRDSYWRVLNISGYRIGHKELCTIELVKVNPVQFTCSSVVNNLNVNGTVGFYEAGFPVAANQKCCELYGYTWDSSRSECFWSTAGGGHGGGGDSGNPHNPNGTDGTSNPDTSTPVGMAGFRNLNMFMAGTHRTNSGDVTLRTTSDNVTTSLLEDSNGLTEFFMPIQSNLHINFEITYIIVSGLHAGDITVEGGYVIVSSYGTSSRVVYSGQTYHNNGHISSAFQILVSSAGVLTFQVPAATGHTVETTGTFNITNQSLVANANTIVVGDRLLGLQDLSGSLLFEDGDSILLQT